MASCFRDVLEDGCNLLGQCIDVVSCEKLVAPCGQGVLHFCESGYLRLVQNTFTIETTTFKIESFASKLPLIKQLLRDLVLQF